MPAERLRAVRGASSRTLSSSPPSRRLPVQTQAWEPDAALVELVRGRLEGQGPTTLAQLAGTFGLPPERISAALTALEVEGFALAGTFTPGGSEREWCERRLLARIHRYTVKRLRAEIEPVSARDYLRFLFDWQGVSPDTQREGARRSMRWSSSLRASRRRQLHGRARSCPRVLPTTSPACSMMPASRAASPGRGSGRLRPSRSRRQAHRPR